MPPSGDDDPAPFEAELRAREARLGPSHPDVAEALSNLAIIHNQVCLSMAWVWVALVEPACCSYMGLECHIRFVHCCGYSNFANKAGLLHQNQGTSAQPGEVKVLHALESCEQCSALVFRCDAAGGYRQGAATL